MKSQNISINYQSISKVFNIAHRGFSGAAPENTIAAFQKALDAKADYIELDIHQTRDGEIVVMHDKTINRTTNGKGKISDFTLDELKNFDAGSWFSAEFKNEKIPTLEEVIELVQGRAVLFIEIKKGTKLYEGIERKTIDLVDKNKARSWCILHSFEDDVLKNIHREDSTSAMYKTLFLTSSVMPFYIDNIVKFSNILNYRNIKGLNLNYRSASSSLIKKAHRRGLLVIVWTVNQPRDIEKMLKAGVDGIITNFPDRVTKAKEKLLGD